MRITSLREKWEGIRVASAILHGRTKERPGEPENSEVFASDHVSLATSTSVELRPPRPPIFKFSTYNQCSALELVLPAEEEIEDVVKHAVRIVVSVVPAAARD